MGIKPTSEVCEGNEPLPSSCTVISFVEWQTCPAISHQSLGKTWERTHDLKTPAKSHRINGPCVFVRSHNPKVVSSNLTPATILRNTKHKGLPTRSNPLFSAKIEAFRNPKVISAGPQPISLIYKALLSHLGRLLLLLGQIWDRCLVRRSAKPWYPGSEISSGLPVRT